MGFPPAEVAAGVARVLADSDLPARIEDVGDRRIVRVAGATITIAPLPADRATHTLFGPRTLLVIDGDGPTAERLRAAIRLAFLRVTG